MTERYGAVMTHKYLLVIDMQEDFVYGCLGSEQARAIVPAVTEKIRSFDGTVIYTKDTHTEDYLNTQEGSLLPVKHCVKDTNGWQLIEPLAQLQREQGSEVWEKPSFGCVPLAEMLQAENSTNPIESLELIGVCTDICVCSNALLLKAFLPETPIYVDASCCAGVTPQSHQAALETMKSCQILVRQAT